ncbi:MAG: cell division protein ZapA, partial [Hyphomicrobiaceae bacterium]|nr:cell division protein ZapA [Hyphomicrobiaceae bacterium]
MRWQGAMGQVAINLNGRSFRFDCGDDEEARLKELAAYVSSRV